MGGSCPRRTPRARPDGRNGLMGAACAGGPGDRARRAPCSSARGTRRERARGLRRRLLFNANAKVDEWAPCAGVHRGLLDLLRGRGFALRQLPCPELGFAGLNRFWQVREQYDTPAYRRHCAALAAPVAELVAADLAGGADVVLIGVDGSPSMGVRPHGLGPDWAGGPTSPATSTARSSPAADARRGPARADRRPRGGRGRRHGGRDGSARLRRGAVVPAALAGDLDAATAR